MTFVIIFLPEIGRKNRGKISLLHPGVFDWFYFLNTVRHSDRWVYNAYTMTFFSEYVSFNLPESNMNDYKKILRALFEKIDFFYFWLKIMGCCKTDFE